MNWSKAVLAGVVAGVVTNIADFVMHGIIMEGTYSSLPEVFTQTQANPLYFVAISICVGIFAAILFAKTRGSWSAGWQGGAAFGFWLGMTAFFAQFYNPLVIDGFPYYLGWCWGGMNVISGVIGGSVLGAIYKS
jgi:hypothetical protein